MSLVFKIFSILCIYGSISAQEISVTTVIEVEDSTKSKKTYFSDYHVDSSTVNNNEIIIIGGNLNVDGTINGKITIIGGDVYLGPTALINGEIIAIGGTVTQDKSAIVKGKINQTNLKEGILYKEIEDQEFENDSLNRDDLSYNNLIHANKDLFVHNRNEGLVFTPITTYWDRNGKSSFALSFELGYRFGSSESIGQLAFDKSFFSKNVGIFASIFKKSRSDDKNRLPMSENSWASFLARQDFYDRWDEEGWSFGAVTNFDRLKFKIEMNYVDIDSIEVINNIWSLFERKRKIRLNPFLINSKT
ncbi:MAG TPA: polymer-forming cytoskeletal protein, partial [Candidatus Marinimicrobia bacterium]|nr:polymer-forming cytoskeletal protein [Candidatus Neomarinimicrobiota bacterium]